MYERNLTAIMIVIKNLETALVETSGKELGPELTKILRTHAFLGVGSGLIPLPGVDIAALIANTWTMYVRINEVIGVKFSENFLKSLATGIGTNLISIIPGLVFTRVGASIIKFVPGMGTAAGMAIGASVSYATVYVMGVIYLKSITLILKNKEPLTEESLRCATDEALEDKELVRGAYKAAKDEHKEAIQ